MSPSGYSGNDIILVSLSDLFSTGIVSVVETDSNGIILIVGRTGLGRWIRNGTSLVDVDVTVNVSTGCGDNVFLFIGDVEECGW